MIDLISDTTLIEAGMLLATFVLCSLIGIERQFRQKAAGYRTHVLVGIGSCAFTLVSGYGFELVLGSDVNLDPSRIAAQIVSGIGFLGAGVIFKGRDVVRGLTTAATIWVAAAVGMACGAGMISLGVVVTLVHLVTLFLIAPLIKKLPTPDRKRMLKITYNDRSGVLRSVLAVATDMGFSTSIVHSRRNDDEKRPLVTMDVRFHGQQSIRDLVLPLLELKGVKSVRVRGDEADDDSL